jgi:hypothetical protein
MTIADLTDVARANDKYRAGLRSTWISSPADTSLLVDAVPENVPTYVVVGWETDLETVFLVTGKSGTSAANYALTGATRIKGANVNLPENTPVNCLNNEEFFNQYETKINAIIAEVNDALAVIAGSVLVGFTITNPTINTTSNADIPITPNGTGVIKAKTTVQLTAFAPTTDVSTGDGKVGFRVPKELAGMDLVKVLACVTTAGTTGTQDIQIRRVRAGTPADMLSTKITIDSTELDSKDAAAAAVIDTTKDDLQEADQIYIDIDAKQTTAAKGTMVQMTFATP